MENQDKEFLLQLFTVFKVEAGERLNFLTENILKLETDHSPELLDQMYREIHSLKGASKAVNIEPVFTICQKVEEGFSLLKKERSSLSKPFFEKVQEILQEITAYLADFAPPDEEKRSSTTLLTLSQELSELMPE